jgi:hypothetical protein
VSSTWALHVTDAGAGGGTQYTEDAAAAANPVATSINLIREDARAGSLTTTDGDNVALRGNNKGEAYVLDTDGNALLTTIDADTGVIAGDTTSIDGKITACNTGAVVLAAGTAEIGKLAAGAAVIGEVTIGAATGAAGDLAKAEDAVHASGDIGVMALAVRNDTLAALAGTDGDYAPVQVDASGAVYVNVQSGAVQGLTDDAAFTPGTSEGIASFAMFDDTTPDSVDEGDAGILRMSANRNLYGTIRDAAGNERGANVSAGNALLVDGSATTQPVSGTVTANPASGTIDTVTTVTTCNLAAETTKVIGTVRAASGGFASGSIASGAIVDLPLPAGAATQATLATIDTDTGNIATSVALIDNSIVAHSAAISGATGVNVVGARAVASVEAQTETTAADASQINATLSGNLITQAQVAPEELVSYSVSNTAGTEIAVTPLGAGGATIHNYITAVTVHNTHATTNGFVQLLDGSGGTVIWTFPNPAGGGTTMNFNPPLKQPTVNTALYWDGSAAITTVYVSIAGYQGQG